MPRVLRSGLTLHRRSAQAKGRGPQRVGHECAAPEAVLVLAAVYSRIPETVSLHFQVASKIPFATDLIAPRPQPVGLFRAACLTPAPWPGAPLPALLPEGQQHPPPPTEGSVTVVPSLGAHRAGRAGVSSQDEEETPEEEPSPRVCRGARRVQGLIPSSGEDTEDLYCLDDPRTGRAWRAKWMFLKEQSAHREYTSLQEGNRKQWLLSGPAAEASLGLTTQALMSV
ncbi:hypothetical protein J1605_003415 [Eschrichtius robustus]|uniref:Uncharacterized protein n=1 Tax=Eschrichtius robustus TaxID=9764 RepID=A0AB34HS85_ESCRO|nr:hypothetical protein J1605_003415 [Eschrichtius robustus]